MSASTSLSAKRSSRSTATKALIIQEYKRRLKDNIKSLNDNFVNIVSAAKVFLPFIRHLTRISSFIIY